jgi:hypothetical protein
MTRYFLAAIVFQASASFAQARAPYVSSPQKLDLEVSTTALEIERTEWEADLDLSEIEAERATAVTAVPQLSVDGYAGLWWGSLDLAIGASGKGGSLLGGYLVADNVYAAVELTYIDVDTETKVSVNRGASTKAEADSKTQIVGGLINYRENGTERLLNAYAGLFFASFEGEVEIATGAAAGAGDVEVDYTALEFGGSYHRHFIDRLSVGAGLSYSMTISGDAEFGNDDGDYDRSSLKLSLLDLIWAI